MEELGGQRKKRRKENVKGAKLRLGRRKGQVENGEEEVNEEQMKRRE